MNHYCPIGTGNSYDFDACSSPCDNDGALTTWRVAMLRGCDSTGNCTLPYTTSLALDQTPYGTGGEAGNSTGVYGGNLGCCPATPSQRVVMSDCSRWAPAQGLGSFASYNYNNSWFDASRVMEWGNARISLPYTLTQNRDNDGFVFGPFQSDIDGWCLNLDYSIIETQGSSDPTRGGITTFTFLTQFDNAGGPVQSITVPRTTAGNSLQFCAYLYVFVLVHSPLPLLTCSFLRLYALGCVQSGQILLGIHVLFVVSVRCELWVVFDHFHVLARFGQWADHSVRLSRSGKLAVSVVFGVRV